MTLIRFNNILVQKNSLRLKLKFKKKYIKLRQSSDIPLRDLVLI